MCSRRRAHGFNRAHRRADDADGADGADGLHRTPRRAAELGRVHAERAEGVGGDRNDSRCGRVVHMIV